MPRSATIRRHVLVIIGFTFVAAILFWPQVPKLTTHTGGRGFSWHDGDDRYYFWQFWWTKTALVDHTHPLWKTNMVFAPAGVDLRRGYDAIFPTLASIPFQQLGFRLVTTYNLISLGSLVVAAYGAFLLAYHYTRRTAPSFIGGLIFGFTPYLLARSCCHLNMVSAEWVPFFALALVRLMETQRWRWLAATAVTLALVGLGSWVYYIGSAFWLGIVTVWTAVRRRREQWRRTLINGLAAVAVATMLVLPLLLPALKASREQPLVKTDGIALRQFSLNLVSFVMPSGGSVLDFPFVRIARTTMSPSIEQEGFLGWVELGILLVVVMTWRRWQWTKAFSDLGMWTALFATFAILALGPALRIASQKTSIPLPGELFFNLPPFSFASSPSRYVLFAALALSVIVAVALGRWLTEAPKRRWLVWSLVLCVGLLTMVERLPTVDATVDRRLPTYLSAINRGGDPGAVLDLPLGFGLYAKSMNYQTVHGRPIIGGYVQRQAQTEASRSFIDHDPFLRYIVCNDWPPYVTAPDPHLSTPEIGRQLARDNIAYVIVHRDDFALCDYLRPTVMPYVERVLAKVKPIYVEGADLVYRTADLVGVPAND